MSTPSALAPPLKRQFREAEERFERAVRLKVLRESEACLSSLVDSFQDVLQLNCNAADWHTFVTYAKCRVLSCFAALLIFKSRQHVLSASGATDAVIMLTSAADLCYAAILCLFKMTPDVVKKLTAYPLALFDVLEADRMLKKVVSHPNDLIDNVRNASKKIEEVIRSYMPSLTTAEHISANIMSAFPPQEKLSAEQQLILTDLLYSCVLEAFIMSEQSPKMFGRLLWLWSFSWDADAERMDGKGVEEFFTHLPFVAKDFDAAKAEDLCRLDIKVFVHLSLHSAVLSGDCDKVPFVQSRTQILCKKKQECWWSSVVAHKGNQNRQIDFECIAEGLQWIRLIKKCSIPPLILHSVARMLNDILKQTKEDKASVAVYAQSYWQALEGTLTGSAKPKQPTDFFLFPMEAAAAVAVGFQKREEREALVEQCRLQTAVALLHRLRTSDALDVLEECNGIVATKMKMQIYEQTLQLIGADVDSAKRKQLEERLRRCHEKLKLVKDDLDFESILSNQELKLIGDNVKKAVEPSMSVCSWIDSSATCTKMDGRERDDKSHQYFAYSKLEEYLIQQNSQLTSSIEKITENFSALSLQLSSVLKTMAEKDQKHSPEQTPASRSVYSDDALVAVAAAAAAAAVNSLKYSRFPEPAYLSYDPVATAALPPPGRQNVATSYVESSTAPYSAEPSPPQRVVQPKPPQQDATFSVMQTQPVPTFGQHVSTASAKSSDASSSTLFSTTGCAEVAPKKDVQPALSSLFSNFGKTPNEQLKSADGFAPSWPPVTWATAGGGDQSWLKKTEARCDFASVGASSMFGIKSAAEKPKTDETVEEPEPADVPDYAPTIALPDLVDVVTGEENETAIFKGRAKLYIYDTDSKEYRERGRGDLKILKNEETGKYRLLMRRDAVHKLCANHLITDAMQLKVRNPRSFKWLANDFADGQLTACIFAVTFADQELAEKFKATIELCIGQQKCGADAQSDEGRADLAPTTRNASAGKVASAIDREEAEPTAVAPAKEGAAVAEKPKLFGSFLSASTTSSPSSNPFAEAMKSMGLATMPFSASMGGAHFVQAPLFQSCAKGPNESVENRTAKKDDEKKTEEAKEDDSKAAQGECAQHYEPAVPLPDRVAVVTGEEEEAEIFTAFCRLYRYDSIAKEHKERGEGNLKLLKNPKTGKVRLVMRRNLVFNVIANHTLVAGMKLTSLKSKSTVYCWTCNNYLDGEVRAETLSARFTDANAGQKFHDLFVGAVAELETSSSFVNVEPANADSNSERTASTEGEEISNDPNNACTDRTDDDYDVCDAASDSDSDDSSDVSYKDDCALKEAEYREIFASMENIDVLAEHENWSGLLFRRDGAQLYVEEESKFQLIGDGTLRIERSSLSPYDRVICKSTEDGTLLCCHYVKSPIESESADQLAYTWSELDYVDKLLRKRFMVKLSKEEDFRKFKETWKIALDKCDRCSQ